MLSSDAVLSNFQSQLLNKKKKLKSGSGKNVFEREGINCTTGPKPPQAKLQLISLILYLWCFIQEGRH